MTPELTVLALAGLLQIVQLAMYSVAGQKQAGRKAALKPRDTAIELTGTAGRLKRAMNNHFEGLILFTLAVVTVVAGDGSTAVTATCAWVYLLARILYIPAYAFGWVPWRSLIWALGLLATALMMIAALV